MSLLELNQNEGGLLSPHKDSHKYLEKSDMPFSPPLFSAHSNFSAKSSGSHANAGGNTDTPLTPTSNSIRGTYSDTSEAASGDTVPSSIGDDHAGSNANASASANTISINNSKNKDSELDRHTMTESTIKSLSEPTPQTDPQGVEGSADRKSIRGDSKETSPQQKKVTSSSLALKKSSSRKVSLSDLTAAVAPRPSSDVSLSKNSLDGTERPQLSQFHSLRRISTLLRPGSKDKFLNTGENDQVNGSMPGSEITRMKTAIVTKNIQRKKDVMEDATCLMGNKITEGHQNFVMAYNMLTGIRVAVSRCSGVMRKLNDADFRATKKLSFDMDGTELTPSSKYDFKFKDYCPEVFRELRSLFGIDPADYLMSITGKYILSELVSSGKSGSFFYYSRDYRFIIKTIHHSEHKQLRRILKEYYNHVKNNPNTMVSQFYGLHRLKVHGGIKNVHFLVMNNLFPPHRDIHIKYDLKGSTWGRYTKVPETTKEKEDLSNLTLKDLNWLERKDQIKFGPEKKKMFLEQLEADVKLLKKINVMDYSLLLGVHDVKKGNSETVARLSVFDPKSNLKAEVFKTNPRDIDRGVDLPSDVFPGRSKYIFYGHNGGIRATNENNEPISEIYYLGIIDCLTNYSLKKRLETAWRSISHSRSTISAVPAHEYGDRFLKFIKDGISEVKVKLN